MALLILSSQNASRTARVSPQRRMKFSPLSVCTEKVATEVSDGQTFAAFSEATDLFRFRCIPGLTVTTDHILVCEDGRFEITSVEDVKGRGMYTEVLAKKVVATSG